MACNIGKEENMEQFKGKVWVLGDDIDTDIIIPTEYLALKTIEEMKQFGFSPDVYKRQMIFRLYLIALHLLYRQVLLILNPIINFFSNFFQFHDIHTQPVIFPSTAQAAAVIGEAR